tara:strand:- start:1517 stop:2053 length:537 start_codon:yes stop_codon:yes gene_type:complete
MRKDENAIVLDYLPHGYPLDGKMRPVVQALGEQYLALLELAPVRGASIQVNEKVYIGPAKRDKIYYIVGRLDVDKMTETAKIQLRERLMGVVGEREKEYIEFFNNAQAINTRLHQLELLPGFGKKHTKEILEERERKKFSSFEDIKDRVKSLPDPKKSIEKRLWEEIIEAPRQRLFVF